MGGPRPGHQPHRRQAPLGQADQGNRWLGEVLIECAWAAARSRDTYLAAQLLAAGPPHRQAEGRGRRWALDPGLAWHLLTDDCDDQDLGGDSFIRRDTERQRQRAVANSRPPATRSPSNPLPNTPRMHISG